MSTPMESPKPQPQWWRVLRSPVGALLRGEVVEARDAQQVLDAFALPTPIAELIRRVIRATRLKKHEQSDVAAELAAHFQDGIDAGATPDELIAAFGDAAIAAKLIRRAKIRNRSALWHATRFAARAVGVTFCSMMVIYVVLLIRFLSGSPTISRDYLAEINAPVDRIPVEQRAWPKWQKALRALPAIKPVSTDDTIQRPFSDYRRSPEHVAESARALSLARAAAKLPHMGVKLSIGEHGDFRIDERSRNDIGADWVLDQSLIGVVMQPLGAMRSIAHVLSAEAEAAAAAGKGPLAVENIETLVALATHTGELPTLISELVSIAIYALALQTCGEILADSPAALSDQDLVRLSHRLIAFREGEIRPNLAVERVFFNDIVQRFYTDDGNGDGRVVGNLRTLTMTLQTLQFQSAGGRFNFDASMPLVAAMTAGRADMVAKYDELMSASIEESQVPLWKKGDSRVDEILRPISESPLGMSRYWLIGLLFPSLQRASVHGEIIVQQRDATLTAIALEMYHRRNVRYPADLTEISPTFLPFVPVDRFDGFRLRYKLVDGRPLLYSVGADGDDDGGRAPATCRGQTDIRRWWAPKDRMMMSPEADGDWLLWPPVRVVPTQ